MSIIKMADGFKVVSTTTNMSYDVKVRGKGYTSDSVIWEDEDTMLEIAQAIINTVQNKRKDLLAALKEIANAKNVEG